MVVGGVKVKCRVVVLLVIDSFSGWRVFVFWLLFVCSPQPVPLSLFIVLSFLSLDFFLPARFFLFFCAYKYDVPTTT